MEIAAHSRLAKIVAAILAIVCCCIPKAAVADAELERTFILDEANRSMVAARTPEDFLKAADKYHQLLERGGCNGTILYNLGTALLKARKYDDARRFLLRAERYSGFDREILRNLQLATAQGDKNAIKGLPWYRFPLFWHYGLPGSVRVTIAVFAFFFFWLALALRFVGLGVLGRGLMILSVAVLALFGSSAATTLHQEKTADTRLLLREARVTGVTVTQPQDGKPQDGTGTKQ